MYIDYYPLATEDIDFPDNSFDVITACQCFGYFNHDTIKSNFFRMLKPNGRKSKFVDRYKGKKEVKK